MKLLRVHGLAKLGKVTSGSATQGLWLGDRKVRSQVVGEDQSRLPERGQLGEEKDETEEPGTEGRREYTDLGLYLRESEMSMSPAMPQLWSWRGMLGSRDGSLTILIIYMSSSKSLTFFTDRFFLFSRPPGLRLTSDAAEKNGKFGRIQCQ